MSIILGLNCYHADSSACIIINGKLKFGIEEERINKKTLGWTSNKLY